ncbi:hypothetical protein [Actinoplanes sp. DH11]|nr:hypothetical protein [Actinoplanes sp. DH11]
MEAVITKPGGETAFTFEFPPDMVVDSVATTALSLFFANNPEAR